MKRRALLGGLPLLGATRALAQPMPLIGPVGVRPVNAGPLFSLNAGPPGKTLDLSFMNPGTLPTGVTFTRGSTATYFDVTGTMQNARVNLALWSGDLSNATWFKSSAGGPVAPVVTGNAAVAPDGTMTAAQVVLPAVPAGRSIVQQNIISTGVATASFWLRGAVGGERTYIGYEDGSGVTFISTPVTLTTAWQRFSLNVNMTGAWLTLGTDRRDGTQSATLAQTIFAWGAQFEAGTPASAYMPTTSTTNGAPRWDYNPSTLQLNGLLIEEARTNLLLNSATLGTQSVATTATATTLSFYGTGSVTYSGTAAGTLNGAGAFPQRASVTFTPTAGTLTLTVTGSVLNAQLEAGAFPTSYIPTTGATVTRSQEQCTIPSANMGFYTAPSGSWAMEYICTKSNAGGSTFLLGQHNNITGPVPMYLNSTQALAQYDGVAVMGTTNAAVDGTVAKVATTRANTNAATACLNAGPVGSASTLTNGYPLLVNGVDFLRTSEVNAAQMKAGYVRRVRYWPRALTNTELQQVTT